MALYNQKIQLIIVGESTVGKSSILLRYTKDTYNKKHLATVGIDYFYKDELIDGKLIKVKIWDTAGQEKFNCITKNFYRNCDGVIIVYDITQRETFEKVIDWVRMVEDNTSSEKIIPKIIVGNKIDLESERKVSTKEGQFLASSKNIPFIETTVKDCNLINNLMKKIVGDVLANFSPKKLGNNLEELNENNGNNNSYCGC